MNKQLYICMYSMYVNSLYTFVNVSEFAIISC